MHASFIHCLLAFQHHRASILELARPLSLGDALLYWLAKHGVLAVITMTVGAWNLAVSSSRRVGLVQVWPAAMQSSTVGRCDKLP